jgi:hypothetical protein
MKAMIKGVGLDFINENTTPARQPVMRITGTKLLLRMLVRFVTLVLRPTSPLFPMASKSEEDNRVSA